MIDVVARLLGVVLVSLLALSMAPRIAGAQPSGRAPRLGYLDLRGRDMERADIRGLRDGLRELGYVEGQTILIEYRFAERQADRLPGILDELLRSKVDILLTVGTVVTQAAQRATATVPIVVTVGDPVSSGFAKSLARPGGNITGLALQITDEFNAKRLELLKEAVPARAASATSGIRGDAGRPGSRCNALPPPSRSRSCPSMSGPRRTSTASSGASGNSESMR